MVINDSLKHNIDDDLFFKFSHVVFGLSIVSSKVLFEKCPIGHS